MSTRGPRLATRTTPIERDGRVLHPAIQRMLAVGAKTGIDRRSEDVDKMRKGLSVAASLGMPTANSVHVTDRTIEGPAGDIPIRVYRRHGALGAQPAIVYFHGGGWVTGDLDSHDGVCRVMAIDADCTIVSVDYRLAPEHTFPAAPDDCFAAYRWVRDHGDELTIDRSRVGVAGDSAGGNLAAIISQDAAREHVEIPTMQGLIYPAVEMKSVFPSHDTVGTGFGLDSNAMTWFKDHYLPNLADREHPRASPLRTESLQGQPPTILVTAGFDPLRDEGAAYARKLADAGVDVTYRCYDSFTHGFFGMGILPDGMAAIREICEGMGELMHRDIEGG